jgi:hypothetical protein
MCTIDERTRIISPSFVDIHTSHVKTEKFCKDLQIRYFEMSIYTEMQASLVHNKLFKLRGGVIHL